MGDDEVVDVVTFVWPDRRSGRMGVCPMAWRKGWSVKRYLHEQPLRAYPLLSMYRKCKLLNRAKQPVKLNYIPVVGDAVVLVQVSGRG